MIISALNPTGFTLQTAMQVDCGEA